MSAVTLDKTGPALELRLPGGGGRLESEEWWIACVVFGELEGFALVLC